MKKILVFILCCAAACSVAKAQTQLTTFILVRHAEKTDNAGDDPPLSAAGQERATRLAAMLQHTKVTAIYSTLFRRTRDTAAPLAAVKQLSVQTYDPKKDETAAWIAKHAGATVVVVGHSNTIPRLANTLTGTSQFADFADTDYGNIIVITVGGEGTTPAVTWLRY